MRRLTTRRGEKFLADIAKQQKTIERALYRTDAITRKMTERCLFRIRGDEFYGAVYVLEEIFCSAHGLLRARLVRAMMDNHTFRWKTKAHISNRDMSINRLRFVEDVGYTIVS